MKDGLIDDRIGFYLMTRKGLLVLTEVINTFGPQSVAFVVSACDKQVENDYYEEIKALCKEQMIPFHTRKEQFNKSFSTINFAIGWRWLIPQTEGLIVLHDSLLPVYRGFAPVVSALLNGDDRLGVTALFADAAYDRGDIIAQEAINISYPIKICEAIDKLSELYARLVCHIYSQHLGEKDIRSTPQDESLATYSVWRDEKDYFIDWHSSASYIKRFIDSLGFPYLGAMAYLNGDRVIVHEAELISDVRIEHRESCIGKVMQLVEGTPIVICKEGLIRLTNVSFCDSKLSALPLEKLRVRFD